MYITNPQINLQTCPTCPTCSICQPACEPRWQGQFNVLGLIFLLVFFAVYFIYRKKLFKSFFRYPRRKKLLFLVGLVFLCFGVLYLFQFQLNTASAACYLKGVLFKISFWPTSFWPFFLGK